MTIQKHHNIRTKGKKNSYPSKQFTYLYPSKTQPNDNNFIIKITFSYTFCYFLDFFVFSLFSSVADGVFSLVDDHRVLLTEGGEPVAWVRSLIVLQPRLLTIFVKIDIKKECTVSRVSCTGFSKLLKKKNGGWTVVSEVSCSIPIVSLSLSLSVSSSISLLTR